MKSKVLLVSKFYYRRGGACVYVLNLERLLLDRGHEVAVFAMDYGLNEPSRWSGFFAPEVKFFGRDAHLLPAARRVLGIGDVKARFSAIVDRVRPDVVHLNNIHSYLSPVVAAIAHERGIRVVWTLHDYKLVCPAYSCRRNGVDCTDCFGNRLHNVLLHRCMKHSVKASALAFAEAWRWQRTVLERCVDSVICPSRFMADVMIRAGYDARKIHVVCNFVDESPASRDYAASRRGDYCCYAGRLSEEKGVDTLLKAATMSSLPLKVAGEGPLSDELRGRYADCRNVEFLGKLDRAGVMELLRGARFSVVPSEWWENNPLSAIESLSCGTPVVGAATGGIPELIDDGNGRVFMSGDVDDLAWTMKEEWRSLRDNEAIARDARARFSASRHYDSLMSIYSGS